VRSQHARLTAQTGAWLGRSSLQGAPRSVVRGAPHERGSDSGGDAGDRALGGRIPLRGRIPKGAPAPPYAVAHAASSLVGLRPIPRYARDQHCVLSCALRAGRARHPLGPPFGRVQLRFFGLYVFGFRCAAAVYPSAGTGFTSGLIVVCCDLEKLASQDWIDRMEECLRRWRCPFG